jgi:hypothetical protein
MNATEAKQKALSVEVGKNKLQMEEVRREITKAVDEAKLKVTIYHSLLEGVIQTLEGEGYTVTPFDDTSYRNESSTTISWA